jgi:hypothetical protein
MPPVSPELQKLAAEAGVDHSVVQYLQARGIVSMGILGALAKSFDEIDAAVVQPFIAGHDIAGVTHQAAPDKLDAAQHRPTCQDHAHHSEPNPIGCHSAHGNPS